MDIYVDGKPVEGGGGGGGGSAIEPSDITPEMAGEASAGVSVKYSRGDHVHPSDSSKQDVIASPADIGAAPVNSPEFTGTPKAPTAQAGANTTQIATTAFVKSAVDGAAYTLPTASDSTLGGVKVGEGLAINENGVLSASGGGGGVPAIVTLDFGGQYDMYLVVSGRQWGPADNPSSSLHDLAGATVTIPVDPANPSISGYFDKYEWQCLEVLNGERIYELPSTLSPGDALYVRFDSCLSPDTLILMADGTTKRLGDVQVGDMVATPFGPDRVEFIHSGTGKATDVWTFSDGTVVKTIGRHRFFNTDLGEPLYLEAWNMGEHALTPNGTKPELLSRETIAGEAPHATLVTEKWNLYYANGLLAGNRKSKYEDLKAD